MFHGSIVALVTPFTDSGVDEDALRRLLRFQLASGTKGIVPVGTTGESPTLTKQEHERVVEITVYETGGQIPIIAGAGSNDTAEAVRYHKHAAATGADGSLHAMGYYNRPNQEGVYRHFEVLNESAELPIVAYNVPPRSVVDIEPATMARLAELRHVVGVKDATRDLTRPLREAALIDKPFAFLSGEDPTGVAYNAQGGSGCISVVANWHPICHNKCRHAVPAEILPLRSPYSKR